MCVYVCVCACVCVCNFGAMCLIACVLCFERSVHVCAGAGACMCLSVHARV
jgi:hypothetical protein